MNKNLKQSRSQSIISVFGAHRSRADVLNDINSDENLKDVFLSFSDEDKERILLFLEGRHSLQILNDKFFQHVMRPDVSFERVESLLSAVFDQPVRVERPLIREGLMISEEGSLVVMDIIVKLKDGSYATVEIQRIGYLFPGERTNCYLADMIMRQYNAARTAQGDKFSYKDMRPVRLIVIMDQSSAEFKEAAPAYVHSREVSFDTGVKVTELENVIYISLDTYRESVHNEINTKLDAWLNFFSYEDPYHVLQLIDKYPEFLPMYKDIAEFRKNPKEVMGMFSEALRIMDRNTTQYWIDSLKQENAEYKQKYAETKQALDDSKQENADYRKALAEKDAIIAELIAQSDK